MLYGNYNHVPAADVDILSLLPPIHRAEAALASIEHQALRQAPTNSQSVEVLKREQNPVLLNESQSFEVVIAYKRSATLSSVALSSCKPSILS